jgi:RES domain
MPRLKSACGPVMVAPRSLYVSPTWMMAGVVAAYLNDRRGVLRGARVLGDRQPFGSVVGRPRAVCRQLCETGRRNRVAQDWPRNSGHRRASISRRLSPQVPAWYTDCMERRSNIVAHDRTFSVILEPSPRAASPSLSRRCLRSSPKATRRRKHLRWLRMPSAWSWRTGPPAATTFRAIPPRAPARSKSALRHDGAVAIAQVSGRYPRATTRGFFRDANGRQPLPTRPRRGFHSPGGYPGGSRFRRAGMTEGVFYGAETPATAIAESRMLRRKPN